MKNNNIIRFVQSLVILPLATTIATPVALVQKTDTVPVVLFQKLHTVAPLFAALNQADEAKAKTLQMQADTIDTFLKGRNSPLAGKGMAFAIAAANNHLNYRLLVAIAGRESTFARNECQKVSFNPFGWNSCHTGFESYDDAINSISEHLGGNNENTDQYYADKTTEQILKKYNSVIPKYAKQVIKIMDMIGPADITPPDTKTTDTTNHEA